MVRRFFLLDRVTVATAGTIPRVTPRPAEELRRLVAAEEWLQIAEVGVLLGVSRQTVHRMVQRGIIRHRLRAGTSNQRELDPEDVRREMARIAVVHGEGRPVDSAPDGS